MMQYYIPNAYDVLKEYIDLYNEIIDKGSDNSYAQSILQYSYIRNDTLKNIIVFLDINYDKLVHAVDFSALVIELHNVVCILCNDITTYTQIPYILIATKYIKSQILGFVNIRFYC